MREGRIGVSNPYWKPSWSQTHAKEKNSATTRRESDARTNGWCEDEQPTGEPWSVMSRLEWPAGKLAYPLMPDSANFVSFQ